MAAILFALRSVAHGLSGFSPAELVYGTALRSPLRLLRVNREEQKGHPMVVQYAWNFRQGYSCAAFTLKINQLVQFYTLMLQRLHDARIQVEANINYAQGKAETLCDRIVSSFKKGKKVLQFELIESEQVVSTLGRPSDYAAKTVHNSLRSQNACAPK